MADLSPDALKKAITDAQATGPSNSGSVGAVVDGGGGRPLDAGVAGEFSVDVGKKGGWATRFSGEWWKNRGGKGGWFWTWTGK